VFKPEEIEQLVAPIALYPDSLVSQILMASTYPLEVVEAVRAEWPAHLPVFFRVSGTDWIGDDPDRSWTIEQSVALAKELAIRGVDLIDVSSGTPSALMQITANGEDASCGMAPVSISNVTHARL